MKVKSIRIILGILLILNSIGELYASSNNAVVLMYHRFGENKYPSTNVRVEQFIEQLNYLEKHDYQVWPLVQIIEYLQTGKKIPDKVVGISIDDAYASVYQVAYPILKRRGLPFTLFVATDPVDSELTNYMSWEQVRELALNGVTIGNHSRSHAHLVGRNPAESFNDWLNRVSAEITYAEKRIEQKTGVKPRLFAYPYGEFNMPLNEALKKMNYVAFGQQSGAIGEFNNFGFLPRFPVSEQYADIKELGVKLSSLSMPVQEVLPQEVVTKSAMPVLRVRLAIKPENKEELQCYISGQGKGVVHWRDDSEFIVKAIAPIKTRRSRYNCTLRDVKSGRYFWYSHLWIRTEIPEE